MRSGVLTKRRFTNHDSPLGSTTESDDVAPIRIVARTSAGEQRLTATAVASFPLATDRSGTVASGTTGQPVPVWAEGESPESVPL